MSQTSSSNIPLVSALVELQRLKRLDRTGWSLRGLPAGTESVAAHSFGVSVTAMLLADELASKGLDIDVEQVLRMAILHDWAEARVGDMPRTAATYFGVEARKAAESAALADIVKSLKSRAQYQSLHESYEERKTLEARLVKAADVIDLLVQVLAFERAGARGLDEFWEVAQSADFKLEGDAQRLIQDVLAALLEERRNIVAATNVL
ncbi:MAG: oxetanocin [Acidobacteria bacterium]|nr:MAG: oxetanocin [Acidobacteriota bacterium]